MYKTIKVTEPVYQELAQMLRPRETFSQVVERTLAVYKAVRGLEPVLRAGQPDREHE